VLFKERSVVEFRLVETGYCIKKIKTTGLRGESVRSSEYE